MICQTCNASNAEAARFCSNCRAELNDRNGFLSNRLTEGGVTRQQSGGRNQDPTLVDAPRDGFLGFTLAGKYRIDAKLGAGGMGAVYRATRLLIGDEVAVKILHSEQNDPRAAERFRREAQAAARLKHPNAVNIYDFGVTDDGLQYLVMELVEGESLRQIMKKQGIITPTVCAWIISEACAALDEAHRHNIIHRDIKPDNLIVNETTSGSRVKVLDFGIAKLRDDAGENLTQSGSILGTTRYMSPEQCLGEDLDGRSDIYSLGVVLYEMLCGRVPFNSPVSSAVVVQHVNQRPPSLRALNASISTQVEAVALHALEKRREARPPSATAFAQELTTAVAAPAIDVPEKQAASTPTVRLDPQSLSQGSAAFRILSAEGASSSEDQANSRRIIGLIVATVLLLGLLGIGVLMLSNMQTSRTPEGSDTRKEQNTSVGQTAQSSRESTRQPNARPSIDPSPGVDKAKAVGTEGQKPSQSPPTAAKVNADPRAPVIKNPSTPVAATIIPDPLLKPAPTPPKAPISSGVLNGKAISLPKPAYPPIARQAHASGTVVVQVVIDENGNVISARAISGHPLLQAVSVGAARGARFSPTKLAGQPVKVTGVITYNFLAQ